MPSAWKIASITRVPKINPVKSPNDLRPISITPILSRRVERLLVKDFNIPKVPPEDLINQYGFKPSGSTVAALIDITETVLILLETNKYVRCLLIDFSKAFDSVDHAILLKKLVGYGLV